MGVVVANLDKLRGLVGGGWKIDSITMSVLSLSPSSWRTTVNLKRAGQDLVVQSDDRDFFDFCVALRPSVDGSGEPAYRRVADVNRYYDEIEYLAADSDRKRREAVQRCISGQLKLDFAAEPLVADFLTSRTWGDSRYLPLKAQYFDVQAVIVLSGNQAVASQARVQAKYPLSERYAKRIGEVLLKAFPPMNEPIRGYLRFADANRVSIPEISKRLVSVSQHTDDVLQRLSKDGSMRGDIGLPYLIDMYRRYADWVQPLLTVLCEAVYLVEGKAAPDPRLGMSKSVDLIRQSGYADIVECFEPRIRHAASHNGVSYHHDVGAVRFSGVDGHGEKVFDDFELSYVQLSEKVREFAQGFIPGIFTAFGMQQQVLLLSAVVSGEYLKLLLLINNEAN